MTVFNGAEWTEKPKKLFPFKFDRHQFRREKKKLQSNGSLRISIKLKRFTNTNKQDLQIVKLTVETVVKSVAT